MNNQLLTYQDVLKLFEIEGYPMKYRALAWLVYSNQIPVIRFSQKKVYFERSEIDAYFSKIKNREI